MELIRSWNGPRDWGRLLTAMLTPFKADGTVNYDEAARLATYLVDVQRNDGLVVSGTTGESPNLSQEEKLNLLKVVLEAVGDRAAVLFGAGTYNTAESIELARSGEKGGAHGIMLVNPYYSKPGQAGLEAHFKIIASNTSLPVLLYNIQPRSSVNLETETLLRLAEVPNIVGVKEASGNLAQISDVCRLVPEGFRVYSGDDALTLPILSLGGYGLVSVVAHVVGQELAEMISTFEVNPLKAREIHHGLTPVFRKMFAWPSPTPIKFATSLLGFETETVRLPLVELESGAKDEIRSMVSNLSSRSRDFANSHALMS